MPKNVGDIDWDSLGYPQIPELLQQLVSDDPNKQREAADKLEEVVVLGGQNWEDFDRGAGISVALRNDAPLMLVPFLLILLDSESTVNKRHVFSILHRMLHYTHMIDEGEVYKQRAKEVRTTIWEGRFTYVNLLSSEDLYTREAALAILMEFKESPRILETYDLVTRRFEPSIPPPEKSDNNN